MQCSPFFHWGPDLYRPPSTHPTTRPRKASTSCQLRTRVGEGVSRHPLSYQRTGFMAWVLGPGTSPGKSCLFKLIDFSRNTC